MIATISQSVSAAGERMRRHRQRQRAGLRCLTIELRETEIDALICKGLLIPESRHDHEAIKTALYAFLDHDLSEATQRVTAIW
jgi:hypothetical protein